MANSDQLYYTNWQEIEAHLIWIYAGVPVRLRGRFEHQYQSAWLIRRGQLRVDSGRGYVAEAGTWVFSPQTHPPRVFTEDAEIVSVKFALRWPDGHSLYQHRQPLLIPSQSCPELEAATLPLLEYVQTHQLHSGNRMPYQSLDLKTYLGIQHLFQPWLAAYVQAMESVGEALRVSTRGDERIVRAQNLLDQHPLDQRLDLQDMASRIGLSLGHADTLFSESYGLTMRGYFDQRKLRAAEHWLEETNRPIKQIAFELGFQDATALAHWFKKKVGQSPSSFRRSEQKLD